MKYIKLVPPQKILNPLDGMEMDDPLEQERFLLLCTCRTELVEGKKDTIEQTEFALEVRAAIRRQKKATLDIGYYVFEDEHARALKKAATAIPYSPVEAEAFLPHRKAVCDQLDELPGAVARPIPDANGAAQPS